MTAKKPGSSRPSLAFQQRIRSLGYKKVVGIDEVGRGALAGPIVVTAIELNFFIEGVDDSKVIAPRVRTVLADKIIRSSSQLTLGMSSNEEIDQYGISQALSLAYQRALKNIKADLVLTDHYHLPGSHPSLIAVKGDHLFYPVAAASIVAKTYRDQLMRAYHGFFPEYGWLDNVGYGTRYHREAIKRCGLVNLHRQSFIH